jgi:hypothetical protein
MGQIIITDVITDTEYHVRTRDSFLYTKEIAKPFGVIDHVIVWCKENIGEGGWRWQLVESSSDVRDGKYLFCFTTDRDLCAFVMKWG